MQNPSFNTHKKPHVIESNPRHVGHVPIGRSTKNSHGFHYESYVQGVPNILGNTFGVDFHSLGLHILAGTSTSAVGQYKLRLSHPSPSLAHTQPAYPPSYKPSCARHPPSVRVNEHPWAFHTMPGPHCDIHGGCKAWDIVARCSVETVERAGGWR